MVYWIFAKEHNKEICYAEYIIYCRLLWQPKYYNRTQHTSHMHMQFGQFLDHDISITPEAGFLFFKSYLSEILRAGLLQRGLPKKGQKIQIPTMLQCPCHEEELSWTFLFLLHKVFVEKNQTHDLLKMDHRSDTTCNRWKKPVEQVLQLKLPSTLVFNYHWCFQINGNRC